MRTRTSRLARLMLTDLWRSRSRQTLTMFCFFVGFFSLLFSLGLRDSQEKLVQNKAQEILTGDAQIHGTRTLRPEEIADFNSYFKPIKESPEVDLNANLRGSQFSTLVELKAVSETFPLVGRIQLDNQNVNAKNLKSGEIWLADELRTNLNLQLEDEVWLGEARFRVRGWIQADVGFRRGATGFAPRAYISIKDLAATRLVQPGSQIQFRHTVLLPKGPLELREAQRMSQLIPSWPQDLRVRTPEEAINGIEKGIQSVSRYLSLLSTLLMTIGFLSGFYLIQIYLRERSVTWALGLIFGARAIDLQIGAAFQVLILMGLSWALSVLTILTLFQFFNPFIQVLISGAELVLNFRSYATSLLILFASLFAFLLPFLSRLQKFELQSLFSSSSPELPVAKPLYELAPYFVTVSIFSFAIAWAQQSFVFALVTVSTLASFAAFAAIGLPFVLRQCSTRFQPRSALIRLALLRLSRPQLISVLIWVALAWISALSSAIPHLLLQASQEVQTPTASETPQFFAINVQPEDLNPLILAVENEGAYLRHASALILARLRQINSQPLPLESSLLRFPVRLTYRKQLSSAEKIFKGEPLPQTYTGQAPPPISIEREFASRNNLQIGDLLEFEVAGLPLTAVVQNLRTVEWASFQPNFFLQFSEGVLEDFPHSFIAVIYGVTPEKILSVPTRLSQKFPNVSFLNLATTLERLREIAEKLLWPLMAVSIAALIFVQLLLFGLSLHLWRERSSERKLMHWLGATRKQIQNIAGWEMIFLNGSSILAGAGLGVGGSVLGAYYLFERWTPPQGLWIVLALGLVSLITGSLPLFGREQK